jgi:hypothetical protein
LSEGSLSAELIARALLKFVGMRAPVDVYDLADKIGLQIRDVPSTGFDGALVRIAGRRIAGRPDGIIAKRESIESEARKRFTIAHEIGHYLLPGHGVDVSVCVTEQLDVAREKVAQMEKEANKFASELLLPLHTVAEIVGKYGFSMHSCSSVSEIFEASLTASASQCVKASESEVALVVTDGRIIKYFQRGNRWKYYIKRNEELSPASLAATLASGGPLEAQGSVAGTAWTSRLDCPDLWEESLLMPRFNRIITLLSIPKALD